MQAVAEGLWTGTDEEPILIAGRCGDCDTWVFPVAASCPRCSGQAMAPAELPRRGELWSYTIQRFQPKEPYDGRPDFEPFGVGYVLFDGKVIVEGHLTENDPARLEIGQPVEVVLIPYAENAVTFGFRPVS